MSYGFFDVLSLIGSLGFFIYGMKVMSEGIQKVAGSKLRQILSSMTRTRFFGILTGFLVTAIIQSSSATTVMTISFVNAGLLSLSESIGVIMGANIGTTFTAWLIAVFGFGKISISTISLPLLAVGLPLLFSNNNRLKSIGETFIGFALLFMGLSALKESVPDLNQYPEAFSFLKSYIYAGYLSTILFVFVGAVITLIVQSSSAAMVLTLTLLFNDVITFDIAAAMVLGENIGTTVTANIAAIVANVHAKRAARVHLLFNLIGVLWMILIFPWFIDFVKTTWDALSQLFSSGDFPIATNYDELQLALFHTLFNITNTILLYSFIPFLIKISSRMVANKAGEDELFKLEYIHSHFVNTPELGLLEVKKELLRFGLLVQKMSTISRELLLSPGSKNSKVLLKKINRYEETTDLMEVEITNYLLKVTSAELSQNSSTAMRNMLSVTNDLESVGDVFYQMSVDIERKNEQKLWFTPEQRNNLFAMYDLLDEAFELMVLRINNMDKKHSLEAAISIETKINALRNELKSDYLQNLNQGDANVKSGVIYHNLFSSAEKVGDYVFSIHESLQLVR
ncbi:MAG: phosphate:Na+ symporter [Flavobacteriales bacterium]|jgi:phosphate:Na+ symporter